MSDRIEAPFSDEQVQQLNRYQSLGFMHPFTCANEHGGADVLQATPEGWQCPSCAYTQSWAHAFMADRHALDAGEAAMNAAWGD